MYIINKFLITFHGTLKSFAIELGVNKKIMLFYISKTHFLIMLMAFTNKHRELYYLMIIAIFFFKKN